MLRITWDGQKDKVSTNRIPHMHSLSGLTIVQSCPHCEIWLKNGKGIIGLWKKYILLYKCMAKILSSEINFQNDFEMKFSLQNLLKESQNLKHFQKQELCSFAPRISLNKCCRGNKFH